jgi:hypothetical protein
MDIGLQKVIDGGVYQAVARDRRESTERLGHDGDAEMAVPAGRSGVAGVQVTLILDGQEHRRKTAFQTLAQTLFAAGILLIHALTRVRLRRFGLAA